MILEVMYKGFYTDAWDISVQAQTVNFTAVYDVSGTAFQIFQSSVRHGIPAARFAALRELGGSKVHQADPAGLNLREYESLRDLVRFRYRAFDSAEWRYWVADAMALLRANPNASQAQKDELAKWWMQMARYWVERN